MTDPRIEVIASRLRDVGKIIAVSSGKGGVGKSMVASVLALNLKSEGHSVGLLDLDFTSPSTHVILGVEGLFPEEESGIVPPLAHGMRYMSITHFAWDKPFPLRGADVSDAIIELLAIIRWGELDYLIIDMPPGLGDATLDTIRLINGIQFLVVTTPSRLAYETVKKQLALLRRLGVPVIGVVENMINKSSSYVKGQVPKDSSTHIGSIDYDPRLEKTLGDVEQLSQTKFYKTIHALLTRIERG